MGEAILHLVDHAFKFLYHMSDVSKEKKERPGWERGWVVNTALQSDTHFPKKYFQCLLQWRKHLKIGMVSSVNDIPMQIKLHHSLQMRKLTVGNLITLGRK